MELGMGVLGWTPDQFWSSTMRDLASAMDGYAEKKGVKREGGGSLDTETLDDLDRRLKQALAEEGRL